MTDDELRDDVAAELSWEPRVDNAAITVLAVDGTITLRGIVTSLREEHEAENAVRRVCGVTAVHCELEVDVLDTGDRDDADLRGDVLEALMLDALLPMTIDARARDGFITLTGTAQWRYQRAEAEFLAASVPGVTGIRNDIRLTPAASGSDIKKGIRDAFRRNARLYADDLSVDTPSGGKVVLTGIVNSWAERDEAVATAWCAPGVTEVDDQILIRY
jgi:osmotically-inducible protein OsmY